MNGDKDYQRRQVDLARALAVLGVKPSTFHSLHMSRKNGKIKKLLEKCLNDRTAEHREFDEEDLKAEFRPNYMVSDLSTIHEAYQFLLKNFIRKGFDESKIDLLSIDDGGKSNPAKRRNSFSGLVQIAPSPARSPGNSRRGSTVARQEDEEKDMKKIDEKRRKQKEGKRLARYI